MHKYSPFLVLVALFGLFTSAWADELDEARKAIMDRFEEVKAENIQPSSIKGLYRVTVPPQVYYMSADARFLIKGSVIDLQERRNLTQEFRHQALLTAVNEVPEESMIIFAPKKPEHTVTVFTDIDCVYCRKLHEHIREYNEEGIAIRYLAYPRAGIKSPSYFKAVSVWCADDRKKAITDAKQGKAIPNQSCDNPVADHYALGQRLGVSGTPALVLESGEIVPGYIPPKRLAAALNGEPLASN